MAKKIRLTENQLMHIINESVRKMLNEGIYGYPDGIDDIILLSENDRECYDIWWQLFNSLMKKARKGVELSVERLAESSWMKKYQQYCFRKFKKEQENYNPSTSPKLFRNYMAERMIEDVNDELARTTENK